MSMAPSEALMIVKLTSCVQGVYSVGKRQGNIIRIIVQ